MLLNVESVATYLQKDIHKTPDKVFAIMSSPWATGSLRSIKRRRPEGFVFTEKFAKELIKEEILKFKKENRDFDEIIDKRVVNILLNGYEVPNPNGKRVKESEIQILISLSSKDLVDQIEAVIMKTYNKSVKFTSSMFSDFIVVRDVFDKLNDFIILNVDEETTEVSIMRNDFLVGTASFPYGKNTFIRQIAKKLNKDVLETISLLSAHKDGHLEEDFLRKLEAEIKDESKAWVNSLKMVFRSLFVDLFIPHNIFLISDKSSEKWFLNLLNKNNFPEFTTTEDSFSVILANSKTLRDFYEIPMNVNDDSNLTMQSIFVASTQRGK
jgi:tRNA uridine 5-carbamoylmethylation protein Kti12